MYNVMVVVVVMVDRGIQCDGGGSGDGVWNADCVCVLLCVW